jgi:hypothetical protein
VAATLKKLLSKTAGRTVLRRVANHLPWNNVSSDSEGFRNSQDLYVRPTSREEVVAFLDSRRKLKHAWHYPGEHSRKESGHQVLDLSHFNSVTHDQNTKLVVLGTGVLAAPWWSPLTASSPEVILHTDHAIPLFDLIQLWRMGTIAPPKHFLQRLRGVDFLTYKNEITHIKLMPAGFDPISDAMLANLASLHEGVIWKWHLSKQSPSIEHRVLGWEFEEIREAIEFAQHIQRAGIPTEHVLLMDRFEFKNASTLRSKSSDELGAILDEGLRRAHTLLDPWKRFIPQTTGYPWRCIVVLSGPGSVMSRRQQYAEQLASEHAGRNISSGELSQLGNQPHNGPLVTQDLEYLNRLPTETNFSSWANMEHAWKNAAQHLSPKSTGVRFCSPKHDGCYMESFVPILNPKSERRVAGHRQPTLKRSLLGEQIKRELRTALNLKPKLQQKNS